MANMEPEKVLFDDNMITIKRKLIKYIISLLVLLNFLVFCGLVARVKIYGLIV